MQVCRVGYSSANLNLCSYRLFLIPQFPSYPTQIGSTEYLLLSYLPPYLPNSQISPRTPKRLISSRIDYYLLYAATMAPKSAVF